MRSAFTVGLTTTLVESVPVEGKTTKKGKPRKVGHLKMLVIDNLKANTITDMVTANVSRSTIIDSDNSTSYVYLKDMVDLHRPAVIPKEKVSEMLPWVHLVISNT